jgi:hypothetical protein
MINPPNYLITLFPTSINNVTQLKKIFYTHRHVMKAAKCYRHRIRYSPKIVTSFMDDPFYLLHIIDQVFQDHIRTSEKKT